MDRNTQPNTGLTVSDDITRLTVSTFVGVLIGLILKTSLDTLARDATGYNGVQALVVAIIDRGWFSLIILGQLLLFLFTLVRFYLGSFRYHQKEPEIMTSPNGMIIDLVGAFGVFISFYIAALFIKTTSLFYLGFTAIQIVDLLWFFTAGAYLNLSDGIKKVAAWYVFFDVVTLVMLIVFFVLEEYFGPWPSYLPQWIALSAAFAIGIWDLIKLWPFYAGWTNWPDSLTEVYFSRRILTLRRGTR